MELFYQTLYNLGYTHPVHPTMVYLPIGGVMAAFIFGIIGVLFKRASLLTSAKHCTVLALIAVFPAILFGYMDWQYFRGGNWVFPIIMKMTLAAFLILLLSITVVRQWKFGENGKIVLTLYTLCFFNVIAIGYFGGEIVFAGFAEPKETPKTAVGEQGQQPGMEVTFADVSAVFKEHCIMCHKGPMAPLGLQLDTYAHVMEGSQSGKVIIPGKPGNSELIRRIKGVSEPAMPFMREPLPDNTIEILVRWIKQGANKGEIPHQRQG